MLLQTFTLDLEWGGHVASQYAETAFVTTQQCHGSLSAAPSPLLLLQPTPRRASAKLGAFRAVSSVQFSLLALQIANVGCEVWGGEWGEGGVQMWVKVWGGRHHRVATLRRAGARHPQQQLRVAAVELSSLPPVLPPLGGAAQSGAQVSGGEVGVCRR